MDNMTNKLFKLRKFFFVFRWNYSKEKNVLLITHARSSTTAEMTELMSAWWDIVTVICIFVGFFTVIKKQICKFKVNNEIEKVSSLLIFIYWTFCLPLFWDRSISLPPPATDVTVTVLKMSKCNCFLQLLNVTNHFLSVTSGGEWDKSDNKSE